MRERFKSGEHPGRPGEGGFVCFGRCPAAGLVRAVAERSHLGRQPRHRSRGRDGDDFDPVSGFREPGRGAGDHARVAEGAFQQHRVPPLQGVIQSELHQAAGDGSGRRGHLERGPGREPPKVGMVLAEVVSRDLDQIIRDVRVRESCGVAPHPFCFHTRNLHCDT